MQLASRVSVKEVEIEKDCLLDIQTFSDQWEQLDCCAVTRQHWAQTCDLSVARKSDVASLCQHAISYAASEVGRPGDADDSSGVLRGVVQLELCFEMSEKFTANHCSGPGRVIGPANVCLSENSRLMPVRSDAAFSSNLSLTVNVNCQSLRLHENCSFSWYGCSQLIEQ